MTHAPGGVKENVMATQERKDKVVSIIGMSVAGGELKLATGMKYFVNLKLDYSNVTFEDAIELASGGSSVRVQAQGKLRGDEATLKANGVVAESLAEAEKNGLDKKPFITFDVSSDFESEGRGKRDPAKTASSAYGKMDREQKIVFVMGQMGVDRKTAETLVK